MATGDLDIERRLLGEIRSEAHAALAAGEAGEVLKVTVREGDRVDKGELLVVIDPVRARAQLRAVSAQQQRIREQLEQARREARRLEKSGARVVAEIEIERAISREQELAAQAAELDATLAEARAVVQRLVVKAPFAGQVAVRSVDPGDYVREGDPVVEIVATDRLEILVEATEDVVAHVSDGDTAELRKDGQRADALVVGVVRALDSRTRTSTVRLTAQDEPAWLLPGGTVDVIFHMSQSAPGAVLVPRDALVPGAVGTRVVEVVDGKAQPRPVEVIARSGPDALVKGDELQGGDTIVTRGNERLRPGQSVQVP